MSNQEPIGVGIIAYESVDDVVRAVRSVRFNTAPPVRILVWDNSEFSTGIKRYTENPASGALYLSAGHNVGCTMSRNHIYREFRKRHPEAGHLCIMDQDVSVKKGWLSAMLRVAHKHKDAGIVAWPVANRYRLVTQAGIVSEVASVCNLHVIPSLVEIEKRWGGPWDERFFMHKFDSYFCQRLNQLGWRTYLVLDQYDPSVLWPQQVGLIEHNHPHRGVRRNPHWRKIFQRSKAIYGNIMATEGWREWVPPAPYLSYYGPPSGP